MWHHNYVIDRNEYLIFTLSESINPWVYSLQFLFKSTNNSWRYEGKCEWVFFFWTQCIVAKRSVLEQKLLLTAYIGSRIWEIDWHQNERPWPLFRGRIKVMSYIQRRISRKPLEIEAWFQMTTRGMAYGNQMKWPMTSRDPERSNSRPQYA